MDLDLRIKTALRMHFLKERKVSVGHPIGHTCRNILSIRHPIGQRYSIFSVSSILLVIRAEIFSVSSILLVKGTVYSQYPASYWSQVQYILSVWHPIGHRWWKTRAPSGRATTTNSDRCFTNCAALTSARKTRYEQQCDKLGQMLYNLCCLDVGEENTVRATM
jgi:hypothetical protein